MNRKKPSNSKNPESQTDLKASGQKKVKTHQEETLKLNLLIDEDDEDFDIKPKRTHSSDNYDSRNVGGSKAESVASANGDEVLTDGNDDECYYCEDGGEILCCDNCFRSFHLECVGLEEGPEGDWICPYCRDLQENKSGECPKCTKTLDEAGKFERITCTKCLRNMHLSCTDVPLSLIVDNPLNKNFMFESQSVKELKRNLLKQSQNADDIVKELLEKQKVDALYHICNSCLSQSDVQKIKMCTKKQNGENITEYYLSKLKRASDIHTFWLKETQITEINKSIIKHFKKNSEEDTEMHDENADKKINTNIDEDDMVNEDDSYQIEKILACRKPLNAREKSYAQVYDEIMSLDKADYSPFDNYKFLIKWEGLEYSYSTWEDQYIVLNSRDKLSKYFEVRKKKRNLRKISSIDPPSKSVKLTEKPAYIEDDLFDYQLVGLNWLINEYLQKNSAILSDELGLGKEIQALCFLRYLSMELDIDGPFLVVTPSNNLNYWQRETLKWCPNLDVIIYGGDNASRRKINDYEFFNMKNKKYSQYLKPKFQIAITTFAYVNSDINKLKKIRWEVVIIDDAQKLKSNESRLYRLCNDLKPIHKIVLSGAPGESSVDEMVNLAKYVIPNKPRLIEDLKDIASILVPKPINSSERKLNTTEEDKGNALRKLSTILEKYMLKRTALDVGMDFTELEEKVIKLDLTNNQKILYKNVLLKNHNLFPNSEGNHPRYSSRNVRKNAESIKYTYTTTMTSLNTVCNHPNLYYLKNFNSEPKQGKFYEEVVSVSNKLTFLEKLIPKLLAKSYKLIIFTQFPLMLDFLEQFFIFKDLEYERIDGATRSSDKKLSIANFQSQKSKILAISADVGDLGIDLDPQDVLILVDNRINIYKDTQAFCKAYPKQKKSKLLVYRLVSQATIEDKIVENAINRVIHGETVQNPLDQSKHEKGFLEGILKYKSKDLFKESLEGSKGPDVTDEKVDEIVSLQVDESKNAQHVKVYDLNEFHISGINVTTFAIQSKDRDQTQNGMDFEESKENKTQKSTNSVENTITEKTEEKDTQVIKESKEGHLNAAYSTGMALEELLGGDDEGSDDQLDIEIPVNTSLSQAKLPVKMSIENEPAEEAQKKNSLDNNPEVTDKIVVFNNGNFEGLVSYYNQLGDEIKDKESDSLSNTCNLEEPIRLKFLEFVLKYEVFHFRVEEVFTRFCSYIEPYSNTLKSFELPQFRDYLKYFYAALLHNVPPRISQYFFFQVKPRVVRRRALSLILLQNKLNSYATKAEQFVIETNQYDNLNKKENIGSENQTDYWKNIDDFHLLKGISKHGLEEWDKILKDSEIWEYLKKNNEKEVWATIFNKIEGKEAIPEKEKECIQFVKDYLKIRSNILLELLLEEKEKVDDFE